MSLFFITLFDGLVMGLLLFMLCSGLTLIFSMMGVLNFAHASFYMLGAYFGYQISTICGFWPALILAPLIVGFLGAIVERYGLRHVHRHVHRHGHRHGHIPELIFTFGLAFLIEESVHFFWGKSHIAFEAPKALNFALFTINGHAFPAYKVFMIFISMGLFASLLLLLTKTRIGLIIQAALSYPKTVENLGHNVPFIFMLVFGIGTAMAALAGVIAGPVLGTFPGMAVALGSIVFVTIVIGGLGSLWGALCASLLVGWLQTFTIAYHWTMNDILIMFAIAPIESTLNADSGFMSRLWHDISTLTLPQIGPLLPYLLMIFILCWRPNGLFGKR